MRCENWKQVTLSEVVTILGDGLHGTPIFNDNGDYYFINGNNLSNGKIVFKEDTKRVTYSEYLKYKKDLNQRTILVSINGTLGNVALYNGEKCMLGKSACYFNVKEEVDKNFIRYIVINRDFQDYIVRLANGTTIKNVPLKAMREYPFSLPPFEEQKAIAATLSCLDNKIELNNKINENLEKQAQAIFKSWFVDFEPFQDGEFEESELGMIPKGWKVGKLSNIANIKMGQSPNGSSYNETGEGTVFYQGRAEFGKRFPSRRLFTTEPKRMAEKDDVLLSVRAPVGDLNVANEQCCIGRGLAAIHSSKSNSSFVLYTMFNLKKQLDMFNGEGTVFGSINKDTLNSMPVLIPTKEVLEDFEKVVKPLDIMIGNNYNEICHLQIIRDSLLPKLMAGIIDVSQIAILDTKI